MKSIFCLIILNLLTTITIAQSDEIIGTWLTEDKEAHVEIYKSANIYYGKITWLKEANNPKTGKPWLDEKNKEKNKKGLPILGSKVLWDFTYKTGEYTGGKVYDSRDGATYSGKIWLKNKTTLKMRGYWGFFYNTETWTKIK